MTRFIKRETLWNDIWHDSIKAAADANHVHPGTMRYRSVARGYTCDEDMLGSGSHNAVPVIINGVPYASLAAAHRERNKRK